MDPDVLLTLAREGDHEAAIALLDWISRGGFAPEGFVLAEVQAIANRKSVWL